jgi:nucleotidyltransferase/DNA polymerase involved in DNA repair
MPRTPILPSCDEAYLDVSGLERLVGPLNVISRQVKAAIREAVGLSASVGIGQNRLIGKLEGDRVRRGRHRSRAPQRHAALGAT